MTKRTKILIISLSALNLIGCGATFNPYGYSNTTAYTYQGTPLYPESYENSGYYAGGGGTGGGRVSVPESPHIVAGQTPVSFQDKDRQWLSKQNGYTISVSGKSRAEVANMLLETHTPAAQFGNEAYIGSFSNPAEAEQALSRMPSSVQKTAHVVSVDNAKSSTGTTSSSDTQSSIASIPAH